MLFDLFKRKKVDEGGLSDYSSLKVDLHSHFLPGIDDGAQTIKDSVAMVEKMIQLGYKKLITTPHVMADYYRNTPGIILDRLDKLRDELAKRGLDIPIDAAAEYYLDEGFEIKLERNEVLPLGKQFLLFELSFLNKPHGFFDIIEKVKSKGYKPVLAHPERYLYFSDSIDNYLQIREAGCYLQLNTISLTGYYGKMSQQIAESLVDQGLVDFMGSDMHHLKHAAALEKALKLPYVKKLLGASDVKNGLLF